MNSRKATRRRWLGNLASAGLGASAFGKADRVLAQAPTRVNVPDFPLSALTDSTVWNEENFRAAFLPQKSTTLIVHKYWPGPVQIFGLDPHAVIARCRDETIESLTILFLDAGTHFGYVPRSLARQTEAENRDAFQSLSSQIAETVRQGMAQLTGGSGSPLDLGKEPMLAQQVTLFRCGNLTARLHIMEEQLIKLVLFRDEPEARHWFDPAELERRKSDRVKSYVRSVSEHSNGDILLDDIPILPQGDRAYCGVSSLAMAMQSLGLSIDTEDYAASAGIRYGSTQGSHIRETYEAAAAEAGFRLSRATRYDHDKVMASIDAGLPVIVWRRWTQERDYLHSMFLRKLAKDSDAQLPAPDATDRATWPAKEAYNHASVITGYNAKRNEVIFSESWSESVRNRRMRPEEMEGTAYYTFLLRL